MNETELLYVPVPDRDTGMRLARGAVAARLAACANLLSPMTSVYEWDGVLKEEEEIPLILKTSTGQAEALARWIEGEHPYDCPCILRLSTHANPAFLSWLHGQLHPPPL